ncbi:hypothetical protein V8F20_012817 [Naviculisporaceae sp. PSN 640]
MAASAPRYLICIDYGTTFTGVAWVLTENNTPTLRDVRVVRGWPGRMSPKVPSEITYGASRSDDHERWGFDLKDRAYVLSWTKMELEPPTREMAMMLLHKTLEEARLLGSINNALVDFIPLHLVRTAEEIVCDYLTEVAIKVREEILADRELDKLKEFPIDLMITHPATWHPKARNSSFRAAHGAFKRVFTEMEDKPGKLMMATEPEACAQYTMRIAQEQGMSRFIKGECFIVVDAGGGTVDLASYRIDSLEPHFKMTKVTEVSGGLFGATRVDEHFIKRFVPSRLSTDDYKKLLEFDKGAERHGSGTHVVFSPGEQHMLSHFQIIKERFAGPPNPGERSQDNWVDLPKGIGLEDDPQRGISQGRLRVTPENLVEIFQESVEGTLHLITEQLVQVQLKRMNVRTIFLSGGFSRNPYLFNRINALTRRWRFNLVRGNEAAITRDQNDDEGSWTAVVKGAALIGLGIGCQIPTPCRASPYHIGVEVSTEFRDYYPDRETPHLMYVDEFDGKRRLKDQTKWMIAMGDLITPEDGIEKTVKIIRKMPRTGRLVGSVVLVLSTDRKHSHDAAYETRIPLDYDLKDIPKSDQSRVIQTVTDQRTGATYNKVIMELTVRLTCDKMKIELVCGRSVDMHGNTVIRGYKLVEITRPLPAHGG